MPDMVDLPQDRMARLRERFVVRAIEDCQRLELLAARPDGAAEIIDIVHKLAGIAGSLGYGELSALAARVEHRLLTSATKHFEATDEFHALLSTIEQLGTRGAKGK